MCNVVLLNQKMAERNCSPYQLAVLLCLSPVTMYNICSGKSEPRLSTARLISDALALTLEEFDKIFLNLKL